MMSSTHHIATGGTHYNGYVTTRPVVLGLAKVLIASLFQISSVSAMPLWTLVGLETHDDDGSMPSGDPTFWLYIGIAAILVLTGGAFAGLTIALMGQDGVHLQVLIASGDGREQRHAEKVLQLLKRGKHWVLVTLLLSNTIVNETLPIILDRSLGGGWPAVVGSTGLIVIFGEVIPQSVCVRYGLSIGAFMVPFVGALMWILCPIAWPVAKLLDFALGEDDHGVVYKKPGLKTLVNLHQTLGKVPTERLNQDEVTIITAVLDLKGKPVGDIMTPMDDVFTMSADEVLNEETIDRILCAGYSRIPIYEPSNEQNFVGMLLVKILITYDPEDCKKVGEFALATLPETRPETSCLDIINFFQEGKSHMVLVSEFPGENYGAIGVVTLEDVIEELIGEEIIDESDVFIDVHKAIRRMAPAPKARVNKGQVIESKESQAPRPSEDLIDLTDGGTTTTPQPVVANVSNRINSPVVFATSPKTTFMRRSSSAADGIVVPVRGNVTDMRDHLKHLGPSNLASRPKTTRYQTVKIKPAHNLVRPESRTESDINHRNSIQEIYEDFSAVHGGEGEGLLKSAGKDASDGVQALQQGYGSTNLSTSPSKLSKLEQVEGDNHPKSRTGSSRSVVISERSSDTLGSMNSRQNSPPYIKKRGTARSGSITENIIEAGGVRKVVLETNSSSSDDKDERSKENSPPLRTTNAQSEHDESHNNGESTTQKSEEVKKKRRRIRKKKGAKAGEASGAGSAHGEE